MCNRSRLIGTLCCITLSASAWAQHAVTSVAGGGATGVAARSASIGMPSSLARDAAGNLYIADPSLNRIYKVTSAGTLTILAGNGGNGETNAGSSGNGGAATAAQLDIPSSVAVDSSGNTYIVEAGSYDLREVNAKTGVIELNTAFQYTSSLSLVFVDVANDVFAVQLCNVLRSKGGTAPPVSIAGNGNCAYGGYTGDGGAAVNAELGAVGGIFVDASGNLFISDNSDNVVREVSGKTGIISTIAGNGNAGYSGDGGAATAAMLSSPGGVWADTAGNVYVADTGNEVVRKITAGKITTIAGNGTAGYAGDGGLATAAKLNYPSAVLVDPSGNVFIADQENSLVREIASKAKDISPFAGNQQLSFSGTGGVAGNAQLNTPSGVFVDSLGDIFIADTLNNQVREVVASTGKIKAVAGTGKKGYSGDGGLALSAEVSEPAAVFVDTAGDVFIADTGNHAIREVISATGKIVTVAGNETPGYTGDGGPASEAQLNGPAGIFVDSLGNLIIADSANNALREVTVATGVIKTIAGTGNWGYTGNGGLSTSAELWFPTAVTEDSSGNIYIADTGNNVIREITVSTGKISTVAGDGTAGYGNDGSTATSAQLNAPLGLYVDPAGDIYIADSYNHVIREVAAKTNIISTVAGGDGEGLPGYLDSTSSLNAEFDTPLGLAADHQGNLYVDDSNNQRIRKIAALLGSYPTQPPPSPMFSPAPGVYSVAQKVTLTDAANGAILHYTTNGSVPTASSTKYVVPVSIAATTTLRAVASVSGEPLSAVSTATYTIATAAPAPSFSPLAGTYIGPQTVTITTDVTGAVIHYTTNGVTPTAASAVYSTPIPVSVTETIRAIAVAAGFKTETVGTAAYSIHKQVASPTFSPVPRGYFSAQAVKLADTTSGSVIYYTVNGATPTVASTKYTGAAIPVSATTTIKAIAVATGDLASPIASGLYTVDNASLVEQRALVQQGLGIGLSTQTFLSQISLSENVLLIGNSAGSAPYCEDVDSTPFTLSTTGHLGGIEGTAPLSATSPGFGTVYYDNVCTKPWIKAELDDWTIVSNQSGFSGATNETADFIGVTGAPLGTLRITEAIDIAETANTLNASVSGAGTFTPKTGAPTAQVGLACSVDLLEFLYEGSSALCYGGIAQNFPNLDASLGVTIPLSFTPVVTPGIAWAGTQLVGVSATGGIFTSPTGSAWTARTSGTSNSLRAVASDGSQLLAVGAAGTVLTSANAGASWTAQSSGTKASLASVVWSGAQYVAVGESGITGVILTSPNGTTWTQRYASTSELIFQGIAWSGTEFVAVGWTESGGGIALSSPNGITWTASASGTPTSALEGVTWSGAEFLVVGAGTGPNGYAIVLTGKDGKTWTTSYVNTNQNTLYSAVWSPQKKLFVAVGEAGTILSSPDTTHWTPRTSKTILDLKAVTWSGSEFAAIGSGNTVVTSPDGATWTVQSSVPGAGEMLHFSSSGSSVYSGALSGLRLTEPTALSLAITGGSSYGSATFHGYAGDLVVFEPTPSGWTATDAAHNQQFQITENNDTSRQFTGSITQITPAKMLATFTVDRSGTGSITYSDGSKATITDWLPAD